MKCKKKRVNFLNRRDKGKSGVCGGERMKS
jgi:hypothetical protein